MNTIWVIATDNYYPFGGLADVKAKYDPDCLDDALATGLAMSLSFDHVSVVDIEPMLRNKEPAVIKNFKRPGGGVWC